MGALRAIMGLFTRSSSKQNGTNDGKASQKRQLKSYKYTNLEDNSKRIRLLVLHSARDMQADVHCTVLVAVLSPNLVSYNLNYVEYAALSYTWGDSATPCQIFVDGMSMNVTASLDAALRHVRHEETERIMWIDAICINQANTKEKTRQVEQMSQIYRNAHDVYVWLGSSDDEIDYAIQNVLPQRRGDKAKLSEAAMPGLIKLFNKPWWTRMWTVQEVSQVRAAPILICGDMGLPWKPTMSILSALCTEEFHRKGTRSRLLRSPETLGQFAFMASRSGDPANVEQFRVPELLHSSCGRHAKDPRDHVYALYGLAAGNKVGLPLPDYSVSVSEAYQGAMVTVFKDLKSLDWLQFAGAGDSEKKLPSWCVDFSTAWTAVGTEQGWLTYYGAVNYSEFPGQSRMAFKHDASSSSGGTIKIRGAQIGRVDKILAHPMQGLREAKDAKAAKSATKDQSKAWNAFYDHPHRALDPFVVDAYEALCTRLGHDQASRKIAAGDVWKTAAAAGGGRLLHTEKELLANGRMPSTMNIYGAIEQYGLRSDQGRKAISRDWAHHLSRSEAVDGRHVQSAVLEIASNKIRKGSLFTTDTGFIGLSREQIQPKDVLCVLYGCRIPAILRPRGDGSYNLVTFAYVDDVVVDGAVTKGFFRSVKADAERGFLLH